MRMKKSTAEKKLRKMGMTRIKNRVICQCLGNRERKNRCRRAPQPQRVLKLGFPLGPGIYGDWFVQDENDEVDSDVTEASGHAGDENDGIFEDFADKVLAMGQDLARMTTKYTTMQILKHARAVTTSKLSRLLCNKMSAWNLAMREEKESVSADLRTPKAVFGYKGWLRFPGLYAKKVANVYAKKREYYGEKVKLMKEESHVGTLENLKRAQT